MDREVLRRWWEEHRELGELAEGIRGALVRGPLPAATVFLGRLSTTLEAHFATEESLYFPLTERASARSQPLLDAVRARHRRLRAATQDLHVLLENGEVAFALRALGRLLQKLRIYNSQVDALTTELERLGSGAHPEI